MFLHCCIDTFNYVEHHNTYSHHFIQKKNNVSVKQQHKWTYLWSFFLFFLSVTFSNLRSNLVANKCQLCVRTAWPGNKTSIVSNWQNFLPSAVVAANQRPAWWNSARSPWQPLHSTSAHWHSHRPLCLRQMAKITPTGEVKLAAPAARDEVKLEDGDKPELKSQHFTLGGEGYLRGWGRWLQMSKTWDNLKAVARAEGASSAYSRCLLWGKQVIFEPQHRCGNTAQDKCGWCCVFQCSWVKRQTVLIWVTLPWPRKQTSVRRNKYTQRY